MESDIEDIYLPLEGFNHGAQLVAIYGLLYRQELAEQDLSNRIEEANAVARRTTGRANDDATDYWVELAQMSCYQEAAHSMAAVSMIAPTHRIDLPSSLPLHRRPITSTPPRRKHSQACGKT